VRTPPRLATRTLAVTFLTVAIILTVVFVVLTLDARDRVRTAETEKLRVAERIFTTLETRRQQEQLAVMATLAENPTLKAALDTYFTESSFAALAPEQERSLRGTVTRETEKLAILTGADVLAIVDTAGRTFVSAGAARQAWPPGARIPLGGTEQAIDAVVSLPGGAFRVAGAALTLNNVRPIGLLVQGTSLNASYAQQLSNLSSAGVVVIVNGTVVARTVTEAVARDLAASPPGGSGTRRLGGEEHAVGTLLTTDTARIYTLSSIDAAARAATRDALIALGTIGCGAVILAALASLWLGRTLSEPINRLAGEMELMTAARDLRRPLQPTGTSRELDALTAAFNHLMQGLAAAEAESRAAYLGAIRALAAALDARDPYTAGHSERVSILSVLMGRQMQLAPAELDVLRLGALLHDIGKIGVSDDVLRKPGALTAEEFEQIKRHPGLGARILRQVPFLTPHLPIVELHHERPDGRGYPFGLRADDIPLAARIVHVADAFDAITSARAYRRARERGEAVAELRRYSGTQFDPASVDALVAALPSVTTTAEPALQELLGRQLV
jgi:putative nucleotidyltransferase with HDIG domain